ncbi:Glutamine-dependent NAD(+) synthetase [Gimesia panareensis]|uniref:Glutamine-dependent NAD(+) synthetase n=1 Tax=Gimesia panareensis TaxID=2527978 RepID=A0A518FUJ1_9PLAN|nr:NAD(+) synthase [Gimesia panareensis]QDV20014.1 Glutamine-dependent NAD(+) synthetase [Gimesia panareensis]
MKLIQIAAVALNQTPLDWTGNTARIKQAIEAARKQGATLICLPELCLTGYGCEDEFFSSEVQQRALSALEELVPFTEGIVVTLGLPLLHGGALYNCACLLGDGQILGFVAKNHLAGDGIHYEPRWFKAWDSRCVSEINLQDLSYPIGNLVFELDGVRIGFEICEDAWAARRPGRELSQAAVDLILNPSASHFAFGKQEIRRRLVQESSRAYGVTYVYSNLLGNESGRIIYDGAALIASNGSLLAEGERLSFQDVTVTSAMVDVDLTRMNRARLVSFQPTPGVFQENTVKSDFRFPEVPFRSIQTQPADWERSDAVKEEEFTRAVALGLFDYLRKSHARGFVISLSGGADSAAAAVLVWAMFKLGLTELGGEGISEKLSYLEEDQRGDTCSKLVNQLLTCVYQSTRNSSETTARAAARLAGGIGADFLNLNVDAIVQSYVDLVSQAMGRELSWETDDIPLQNIQARSRAPGVWMIANLRNALLLSTSNRSEAAVGYTTMDGDTCGGLAPISGIDKAFLRSWLEWMEQTGPLGVGKVAELDLINQQEPTAELRPQAAAQKDEVDLMPYELLDWVERAAIRDKRSPLEVFQLAQIEFPAVEQFQLLEWIERFFRLWSRNQWKRERYAPSFHLDDENLDPKTWCRFPILSGGFEQELAELRRLLSSV